MEHASGAVAAAAAFTWLGMLIAISFLEAPLKFRAPGVTVPIGLGIGRLVFRALNIAEVVLGAGVAVAVAAGDPPSGVITAAAVGILGLIVQLVLIRPRLNRRSDRVLAGEVLPRSHAHTAYIGVESLKVLALFTLGVLVLA